MTLVIAHKIENHISLSSDSRIGFGEGVAPYDYGIKIFSVPVKIFSPRDSETSKSTLDYEHTLGLAIVGSFINSYTIKESIYEILQNLQYIPGYTNFSMDGIANVVFTVYKKVTKDLGEVLREKGLCEIILAGYCPSKNKIRTFLFSVCPAPCCQPCPLRPISKEILQEDCEIDFFGTGQYKARTIFQESFRVKLKAESMPFHIIRKIVNDRSVSTVGGEIQYGEFNNSSNFKVYGIADYEVNEDDGKFKRFSNKLRGIDLYKEDFEKGCSGFHISYTFKAPFENEIRELWLNNKK
jgi:hypothetical protein